MVAIVGLAHVKGMSDIFEDLLDNGDLKKSKEILADLLRTKRGKPLPREMTELAGVPLVCGWDESLYDHHQWT